MTKPAHLILTEIEQNLHQMRLSERRVAELVLARHYPFSLNELDTGHLTHGSVTIKTDVCRVEADQP